MRDFNDIYYNSVECLRCNLCLDRCPAVRTMGTDKTPMYSSVYSALGSRFDLEMVTEEAFMCIDCYECESACPVNVPIADTFAYIRRLCKEKKTVPGAVTKLVNRAEAGDNILGSVPKLPEGKAELAIFLGYAGELDEKQRMAFERIIKAAHIPYTYLTKTADSGYFLDRSGQSECVKEAVAANVNAFERVGAKVIVTPCSYSYEAFKSYYPQSYTYLHMGEFLLKLLCDGRIKPVRKGAPVAFHGAHMLSRRNEVDAALKLISAISGQKAAQPGRTGYKTASSGIGGGLGLFCPQVSEAVTRIRAGELADLGFDTVVTDCVFEKYALQECLKERNVNLIDITEYVAQAM